MNQQLEIRHRDGIDPAVCTQPGMVELAAVLAPLGGRAVIAPDRVEPLLVFIARYGFVMAGPVARRQMAPLQCHANIAAVWREPGHGGLVAKAVGFALSRELDMWVTHTWGLLREGVLETTTDHTWVKRFGVPQNADLSKDAR